MNITTGAWQLMPPPPPPPHPSSARAERRDEGATMSRRISFASASIAKATAPPTTCLRYLRMGAQALLEGWSDGVATKLHLGWHTPSVPFGGH